MIPPRRRFEHSTVEGKLLNPEVSIAHYDPELLRRAVSEGLKEYDCRRLEDGARGVYDAKNTWVRVPPNGLD